MTDVEVAAKEAHTARELATKAARRWFWALATQVAEPLEHIRGRVLPQNDPLHKLISNQIKSHTLRWAYDPDGALWDLLDGPVDDPGFRLHLHDAVLELLDVSTIGAKGGVAKVRVTHANLREPETKDDPRG